MEKEGQLALAEKISHLIDQASQGVKEDMARKLIDLIFLYAHHLRASDIHFEPMRTEAVVRYRIDGFLQDMFRFKSALNHRLISVIKVYSRLRTDEHRVPQDGRLWFDGADEHVDVRVSVMPVEDGERAVLRLLSASAHALSLSKLGLKEDDQKKIEYAVRRPWGLVLTTGPTGCGKTTTIYSILDLVNTREQNIATIENPVEYYIDGINQSQVDVGAGYTFAKGLRAVMRQDPDVIMVGEIRDTETAEIAVDAALTGHRVFSTLHTNSASATIPRLLDRGIEPFLVASTLTCSIGQRLVRRVCPECWESRMLSRKEAKHIFDAKALRTLFGKKEQIAVAQSVGCLYCHGTGYRGRVGIFEVLPVTKSIQELIIARASSGEIEEQAIAEGMTTLYQDAVQKVASLETSLEEFIRIMHV